MVLSIWEKAEQELSVVCHEAERKWKAEEPFRVQQVNDVAAGGLINEPLGSSAAKEPL